MATKSRKYRRRSCKHGKLKKPVRTKNGGKRRCKKSKRKSRKMRRKKSYRMNRTYRMDNGPGRNYEETYVRNASKLRSRTRSGNTNVLDMLTSIPQTILQTVNELLQGKPVTKKQLDEVESLNPDELDRMLRGGR